MNFMNNKEIGSQKILLSALGLLVCCLFCLFLLFAATKGQVTWLYQIIPFLRNLGYQSDILVWFFLGMETVIALLVLKPWLGGLFHASRPTILSVVCLPILLLFSAFPLGNLFKEGTLFYKNWMWYFTFWVSNAWILAILTVYLLTYKSAWVNQLGTWFHPLHAFLRKPTLTKQDWLFLSLPVLFTLCGATAVCFFVLNGIPHVQDSIAQLFQARIFALGRFYADLPQPWDFFERVYLIPDNGRFYSIFPPGHALILALGVLLKIPYLINPISSCLIVLLIFFLAKKLFSLYVARLSVIFLSLSPFFIFMGGGYMNHPTCLLFLLLFFHCFLNSLSNPRPRTTIPWLLGAGFFFGMATLTRPQTAIVFIPIAFVWGWREIAPHYKRLILSCAVFCLGGLPTAAFLLTFNAHTTGSPFIMGYQKNFRGNPLGLGTQNWEGRKTGIDQDREVHHTPLRGFSNFLCNLNGMNYFLFGWPIPSLFFAFALFLPGLRRGFVERMFIWIILLVGGVYFFFFYQDFCFGPRFFFETLPLWLLLSARGIEEILAWGKKTYPHKIMKIQGWFYFLLCVFFLCAFATVWVERIVVMSDDYWGTSSTVLSLAEKQIPEEDALIFVHSEEAQMGLYSVLDPRFDRGWIIARHFGWETNQELIEKYPGWPIYFIWYNNVSPPSRAGYTLKQIRPKHEPNHSAKRDIE
ncbi:hypothetical protein GF373_15010 [bacterium]|nr:hypothetical protein [bacterium]